MSHQTGRNSLLPSDANARKAVGIWSGVLSYFPNAIIELARCSSIGGDRHHPGAPVHWERDKSADHEDCLLRHLMERGTLDDDGIRHSAKVAWRALAMLQIEIEAAQVAPSFSAKEVTDAAFKSWLDNRDEILQAPTEVTGCADDCTHPSHVHRLVPRHEAHPLLPLCTCRGTQCHGDPKYVRCRLKASLHDEMAQAVEDGAD